MIRMLADSWDSLELWLTQLPFPFQVVVGTAVLLPLCWFSAAGVDRLVELAARRVGR